MFPGIMEQAQALSYMLLLQVDYQLSFLKYLIHELVSQKHLLIEKYWNRVSSCGRHSAF